MEALPRNKQLHRNRKFRHPKCFTAHRHADQPIQLDMQWNKLSKKSRNILTALAHGHPCEQILAEDPTVTYHDIFHAAAESPTRHWKKKPAPKRTYRERNSAE
jgi:hypothetical protein